MIAWWRRHLAVVAAFAALTWAPPLVQWAVTRQPEYLTLALVLAVVWVAGTSAWLSRQR